MSQQLAVFDQLKADVAILVGPTLQIAVVDAASCSEAAEVAKQLKAIRAEVDRKRKELTGPLNDQVKMINEYCHQLLAPVERSAKHVGDQLDAFAVEQERIKQERIRKIEQERREAEAKAKAERDQVEAELRAKQEAERQTAAEALELFGSSDPDEAAQAETNLAIQQERERVETQARLEREDMSRLIDEKQKRDDAGSDQVKNARKNWDCEAIDLSKVPREFLLISLNKPAILAAARGGVTEIAGVRIWQKVSVAIGRNTYMPKIGRDVT